MSLSLSDGQVRVAPLAGICETGAARVRLVQGTVSSGSLQQWDRSHGRSHEDGKVSSRTWGQAGHVCAQVSGTC